MDGEFALDSNIAIAFLNGLSPVVERVRGTKKIALPLPVVGELLFGAKKSGMKSENLQRFRCFISRCKILPLDRKVADFYSDFKLSLKKSGTPIPENDIWIAACSHRWERILVTNDRHFDLIEGLATVNWLKS